MSLRTIAVIGDRNPDKIAHRGIEASLALFSREFDPELAYAWVGTDSIAEASVDRIFRGATGIWCAPGSPYASTSGALLGIRFARSRGVAFLGTCGGFQHALMEYAAHVLGRAAEHEELNPAAPQPLIAKLRCSLHGGVKGKVIATPAGGFAEILGRPESIEEFNCNYGLNAGREGIFQGSGLAFVARDETGEARAFRLAGHPFFVGTLFQPERAALAGKLHPVVRAFLQAAA